MSEDKDGLNFYWFTMGNGEGVYHTSTKNQGENFAKRTLINKNAKHTFKENIKHKIIILKVKIHKQVKNQNHK